MGFITTATLNNDCLDELNGERGLGLGPLLRNAVLRLSMGSSVSVPIAGITVVESHHADYCVPVLVGGGAEAKVIKNVRVFYTSPDPELEVLKELAEKHRFALLKKRAR